MSVSEAVLAEQDATSTAVYVYGVGRAREVRAGGSGIGGSAIELIPYRNLAAITGRVRTPVRARRRDLLMHTEVLQRQFANGTVLPFRFGTVLATPEAVVEDVLAPRYDDLARRLDELDGSAELTVRAFYVEEAVFAEIVRSTPRIARLREASRKLSAAAGQPLSVELGEAVAQALASRRRTDGDEIVSKLVPLARDVVVEEQRAELEVLRAAFLVDQDLVPKFDARMNELAQRHQGRIVFKYVGPLPPHSFASEGG